MSRIATYVLIASLLAFAFLSGLSLGKLSRHPAHAALNVSAVPPAEGTAAAPPNAIAPARRRVLLM